MTKAKPPKTLVIPGNLATEAQDIYELVQQFANVCDPVERQTSLYVMTDARTGARYCECHIKASKLVPLGTTTVPLDPEEQPEYKANREILADHAAFERMKEDAKARRTFSHIVAEFATEFDEKHPIKIIGGQHRFEAIKLALRDNDVDECHGVKMYFALDAKQRLDVQLISNTNMVVSMDLYDRMHETVSGKELREWCQKTGLLEEGRDFADRRLRNSQISVRVARTFIINYFKGKSVNSAEFSAVDTTPTIAETGTEGPDWSAVKAAHPDLWNDEGLLRAGTEFAALVKAQRAACGRMSGRTEHADRALNLALVAAWAFIAGALHNNQPRLERHYAISGTAGRDPLNGAVLAKGRHKTDPDNYRGLGNRSDARECGRFAELFFAQAEKGEGISKKYVELAIARYHAKQAKLEADRAEKKVERE